MWKNEISKSLKFIQNKTEIKVKHYSFPEDLSPLSTIK